MALREVKLKDQGGTMRRVYSPQPPGRFTRDNFGALEPPRLVSIMSEARRGYLEDFADLCSYAVRTDPTLRSLVITRIAAVAGADIEVTAGLHGDADQALAEEAADFIREAHERVEEWEDRFGDLLWGTFVNVSAVENVWLPERGTVWGGFKRVLVRDLRYQGDWELEFRTYEDGSPKWERISDHPSKFTVNTPANISERPTMTGEMWSVLWPWLFKRWVEKDGLDGFARLSNGLLYRQVPENADDNVITKALDQMENIGGQGVAVFNALPNGQAPVAILEMSKDPGATAKMLVDYYNGELAKAILGSGLNVEVGSTGGNRALGESQFATTILPRLQADAKRALGAVRRDWVRPLLAFNRHLFGGRMPPVPYLVANLVNEEKPDAAAIAQAVQAGAVTVDELRASAGLDAWGPERGGDRVVSPLAKVQPGFSSVPQVSGGAPPPAPFARTRTKPHQLKLPLSATPTVSASASPLSIALSRPLDDPER